MQGLFLGFLVGGSNMLVDNIMHALLCTHSYAHMHNCAYTCTHRYACVYCNYAC
uniref:Uncharacterized protein n=1 Tax=Xiphophorus couchianus TaxID=32473 RepID=A0A3B5MPL6_9TELE